MLGTRIQLLRTARHWSQRTLAQRAQIGQSYLSQLESGHRPDPGIGVVIKLATAFGLSLDELVQPAATNDQHLSPVLSWEGDTPTILPPLAPPHV